MKTNFRFEQIKAEVKFVHSEIILFTKVINEQILIREIQSREALKMISAQHSSNNGKN